MTDLETIELALCRARGREFESRIQDLSVILAFDRLIEELRIIARERMREKTRAAHGQSST